MSDILPPDSSVFPDDRDDERESGHSTGEILLSTAVPTTTALAIPEPQRVEPPPTPRRRRWLVRLGLFTGLVGATGWFAPVIVAKTPLRNFVLGKLTTKLNATTTVGGMSLGWKSPIELRDVRIASTDGSEAATVPVARTSKTLLELIRNSHDLGTITVERPHVTLTTSAATSNIEDILKPILTAKSSGGDRVDLVVRVSDGTLTLKDAGSPTEQTLEAVNVTITVPKPADTPIRVEASATAPHATNPGKLDADLKIGSDVAGKVTASGFPVAAVGPIVRRYAPGTELAGSLSADVTGNTSLGEDGSLNGKVTVIGLDVAGPWLGTDRLRLAKVELPCQIDVTNSVFEIEQAELKCDVGSISVVGRYNPAEPSTRLFLKPGLRGTADVDVAKLAALLPGLLRIREGTEVHAGRVKLSITTDPFSDNEIGWMGRLETTALKGSRNGQLISWDAPLWAECAGKTRVGGWPEFDKLECQSDFFGLAARGGAEKFVARANLNLDKLSAHLGEFVDLHGVTLSGAATVTAEGQRDPNTGVASSHGTAQLTKFVVREGTRIGVDESDLALDFRLAGVVDSAGPIRLNEGTAELKAAQDQDRLAVVLLSPIPNVRTANAGNLSARMAGDLGRWRNRLGWLGLPPTLAMAGTGTVSGQLNVTPESAKASKLVADLVNLHFRGFGLDLDERSTKVECSAEYDRQARTLALTDVRLSSQTVGASSTRIDLTPTPTGDYRAKGIATVSANLNRVQRSVGMSADPLNPAGIHGLANGDVQFDVVTGGVIGFDAAMNVEKFAVGPPQNPTWQEPWVKLASAGRWNPQADTVTFDKMRVERDGLSAEAKGTAARMGTPTPVVNFEGSLAYDLAKLEPQLREVLGSGAMAVGKESKPFKLSGSLGEGGRHLTVAVEGVRGGGRLRPGVDPDPVPTPTAPRPPIGAPGATGPMHLTLDNLAGSAAVGWQQVKAYGFEVGPGELAGEMKDGVLNFKPVEAKFGGGTVKIAPTIALTPNVYPLTLAPGRIVEKAKLTPEACANAVGFVLPPLANAAQVEGLVSLDVTESRIPLVSPNQAAVKGILTVHTATVSAGPMLTEIASALGAKNTPLTLTTEQNVPFRVENGRVYHDSFILTVEKTSVKTSGSVGLDGTVAMLVEVQFPPRLAQQLVPNNPRIREALMKQTIRVPVGGTLQKPKVDAKGMQVALQKMIQDATKNAAGGFFGDLLNRQTEK